VEIDVEGIVWVESRCRLPTQCLDWGKNQRNVNAFLDLVDDKGRQIERERAGRDDRGLGND
jgi:hypothetical protein